MRRREFGFVFQFGQLVPELTAVENVELPLLLNGMPRAEAHEHAREWLTVLGASDAMNLVAGEFSGGQAQLVAVARAVVHEPRVLFADEPTGALQSAAGWCSMTSLPVRIAAKCLRASRGRTALLFAALTLASTFVASSAMLLLVAARTNARDDVVNARHAKIAQNGSLPHTRWQVGRSTPTTLIVGGRTLTVAVVGARGADTADLDALNGSGYISPTVARRLPPRATRMVVVAGPRSVQRRVAEIVADHPGLSARYNASAVGVSGALAGILLIGFVLVPIASSVAIGSGDRSYARRRSTASTWALGASRRALSAAALVEAAVPLLYATVTSTAGGVALGSIVRSSGPSPARAAAAVGIVVAAGVAVWLGATAAIAPVVSRAATARTLRTA